jgi:hypothetical protein
MSLDDELQLVSDSLLGDILKVLDLPHTDGWRSLCALLFGQATQHLAKISLTFNRMIIENGLRRASDWALTRWCHDIRARGQENVPAEGPLLVVSNHPGA